MVVGRSCGRIHGRGSEPSKHVLRPNIGAAPAASLACKSRLDIGEPDVIGPSVCGHRSPMAAVIILAGNRPLRSFGLLQHYRHFCDMPNDPEDVRYANRARPEVSVARSK